MKKIILYIIILVLPFLGMVLVNEVSRQKITDKPYVISGIVTINSKIKTPDKCTWTCHNNTNYCKIHHVKIAKSNFKFIDPIYYLIILLLQLTGGYALANILILVIMAPLFFYILLIKSINIQFQINKLKKGNG
ncbi:MAG TPA: hypothetical protein VIO43_04975 [Lutibacter sp.]